MDSSSEENPLLFACQKDLPIELKFEKILDNDSGQIVRLF
jgi:hypothetical protein